MDAAIFSIFRREAVVVKPTGAPFGAAASEPLVAHDLLALADPASCTLTACYDAAGPVELAVGATGLYCPTGQAAPVWQDTLDRGASDAQAGLAAGTRLLTARGEVAVEALQPGDAVMALRGTALLPILWVGRSVAVEPPVVIQAGALGQQRPNQTLIVAAGQPIFLDPRPVCAKSLVNGTTIQQTAMPEAALFQIDVGGSEVIFAQNVPVASAKRPTQSRLYE